MFGYIYKNKTKWFSDCMESKQDHFIDKNIIIKDFIEISFYRLCKLCARSRFLQFKRKRK